MKKRLFSLITALCLCLSLLPGQALAAPTSVLGGKCGVALAGTVLTAGKTYAVVGGALTEVTAGTENSLTLTRPTAALNQYTLTINGSVVLPSPVNNGYGMELCLEYYSKIIVITGGALTVTGAITGRTDYYNYSVQFTLRNAHLNVEGSSELSPGDWYIEEGSTLSAPKATIRGSVTLSGNSSLEAGIMGVYATQTITIESGSTANFTAGEPGTLPEAADIGGTLSFTNSGQFLTASTTSIQPGGSLRMGGVEMEYDPETDALVPKGTVDKSKVGRAGLDLTNVTEDAVYTGITGTLTWDADTKTLTLDNASIQRRSSSNPSEEAAITLPSGDVTLKLIGENRLTAYGYGIKTVSPSSLTVNGTGSLDTRALSVGGTLTLNSGTLSVSNGGAANKGVSAGTLNVCGGILKVPNFDTAVSAPNINISGGVVEASGNTALYSRGGGLNISGGSTTVSGKNSAVKVTDGSGKAGNISISGGTLTATCTATGTNSEATIYAYGTVDITGGDVYAKGTAGNYSGIITSQKSTYDNPAFTLTYSGVKLDKPAGGRVGNPLTRTGSRSSWSSILASDGTVPAEVQFTGTSRGTLALNDAGNGATGAGSYAVGSTVAVTPGTREGALFKCWTVVSGDAEIQDPTSATAWVTLPTATRSVIAPVWVSPHTVTLADAGDGATGDGQYRAGDTVTVTAGTKAKLDFKSWSSDDSEVVFKDPYVSPGTFTMPDHDVTVTANWQAASYTVTIENGGEGVIGAGKYRAGDTVTIRVGTKPNATFFSWSTSSGMTGINYDYRSPEITFTMPANNVSLGATWKSAYTVTVVNPGATGATGSGTYAVDSVVTINAGTRKGTNSQGFQANMAFDGWEIDDITDMTMGDRTSPSFSFYMPNHPVTVTAKWHMPIFNVSFTGGGEGAAGAGVYEPNTYVNIDAGTREHYDFVSWRVTEGNAQLDNANSPSTRFLMPDSNVKLEAVWTAKKYKLTVVSEGTANATPVFEPNYTAGQTVSIFAGTRNGYDFKGWTSDNGGTFGDPASPTTTFKMPGGPTTITAHWEKEPVPSFAIILSQYKDSLEVNGEPYRGEVLYFAPGTVVTIVRQNPDIPNFQGWVSSEGLAIDEADKMAVTLSFVMPEHYVRIIGTWWKMAMLEISGTGMGGSESGWYKPGESVPVYAGVMPGKTFGGWQDSRDEYATRFDHWDSDRANYTMPEGTVTISPKWQDDPNTYTLLVKGTDSDLAQSRACAPGEEVTVAAGSRAESYFAGWTPSGVSVSDRQAETLTFTMPANDVTLVAGWRQDGSTVTLHFAGEGATGAGFYRSGSEVTVYAGTKEGCRFAGWEVTPGDVTLSAPAGDTTTFTMPDADVEITAKWTPLDYTLTLNGLAAGTVTSTQPYGEPVTIDAGEKAGYDFAGWVTVPADLLASPGQSPATFLMPASDVTATATWKAAPDEQGALTLYLDDFAGDLILEEDRYTDGGTGKSYPFDGPYVITQRDPGTPLSNSVRITWHNADGNFDVTLKDVNLAAQDGKAAVSIENDANVTLTLSGDNTLSGGSGKPGIQLVSTGSGTGCVLTVRGTADDVLTVTGGDGGAGIGAGSYGVINLAGGSVTAVGGTGSTWDIQGGSVRLGSADGSGSAPQVTVSGSGRISGQPAVPVSSGEEHNFNWNGILFEGPHAVVYVGEDNGAGAIKADGLTLTPPQTLTVPKGTALLLPENGLNAYDTAFRGEGRVIVGGSHFTVGGDGSLVPCEAELDRLVIYPRLRDIITGTLGDKPLLYGESGHMRLLSDVNYPEDIVFDFQRVQCANIELDLDGKTLDMGAHRFVADVAERYPGVEKNHFVFSDSSPDGSGKITGSSDGPVVSTQLGLLRILGGSFVNEGSGPALRIENYRASAKLEGGSFSSLDATCRDVDDKLIPLVTFLGEGKAFYNTAHQAWITPVSTRSALTGVTVATPDANLIPAALTKADGVITVTGVPQGAQATYRWLARPYEGGETTALTGAAGASLKQDSGAVEDGSWYVSCVVTVESQSVLTDEILAEMEKAEGSGGDNTGGSTGGSGSSRPDPAAQVTVTVDGKSTQAAVEDGTVTLPVQPLSVPADPAGAPSVSLSLPERTLVCIPVDNITAGTVAVAVHDDGTEEVIKISAVSDEGLTLRLEGNVTVKVADRSLPFSDTAAHWAAQNGSIDFVTSRNLFYGTQEGTFSPNASMTRGMVAAVLYRLAGEPDSLAAVGYSDVGSDRYYTPAIAWAAESGIVRGVGDNHFAPERDIDRESLCVMLYRYAQHIGCKGTAASLDRFPDARSVSDWARDAMGWCVATGLIRGRDNGLLDPHAAITRAETATLLQRLVEVLLEQGA